MLATNKKYTMTKMLVYIYEYNVREKTFIQKIYIFDD